MAELTVTEPAREIYETIADAPIISPHGHTDPAWFARNTSFSNPAELIITPDHYVFRMLYSQGIPLEKLGVGSDADPREIWALFTAHYHLFLGTPSRLWLDHMFEKGFGIDQTLSPATAMDIYEQIDAKLATADYRPRALFERFNLEILATTDGATDTLEHHASMQDDWPAKVIPTFRPDTVLDPADPRFLDEIRKLALITNESLDTYGSFLNALRKRRATFKSLGATATDHAIEILHTNWLDQPEIEALYDAVRRGTNIDINQAAKFYGHMLIEMARMSCEDGLVMQLHAGSKRNTNASIMTHFGRDKGADIPVATGWVRGLEDLLNQCGNHPNFTLIAFTLDETTYARELAPMAGHWPCLKIGPPWWFHDSPRGIARYLDQVVETAGYANLAGFNDDTRAFMSIPARHDLWRRAVSNHLATQVKRGYFNNADATRLAQMLAVDLAREAYKLGTG
ncbi:MAG: glucuronate isomerase [Litoreibacter sp.]